MRPAEDRQAETIEDKTPEGSNALAKPLQRRIALEDWELAEDEQIAALDALRDRYLVEEMVEAKAIPLLKQHNLIRSLSLSHLRNLIPDQTL